MRRRAFCYITRAGRHGPELLVFRHDDPDAGVQTPGGTIEPQETALEGARRQAIEKTGLTNFAEAHLIAIDHFDHPVDPVKRHHVYFTLDAPTPDSWTHRVSAGDADAGMLFHFFWLTFPQARMQVLPFMITRLDDIADRMSGSAHAQSIS